MSRQRYTIEFSRKAERQFRGLSRQVQLRLSAKIESLGQNPRPRGAKKLEGVEKLYRISVGDYRVIYEVRDDVLVILVVKVGDRKEVYRRLG